MSVRRKFWVSENEEAILALGVHALLNRDFKEYAEKQKENVDHELKLEDFADMVECFSNYLALTNRLDKFSSYGFHDDLIEEQNAEDETNMYEDNKKNESGN